MKGYNYFILVRRSERDVFWLLHNPIRGGGGSAKVSGKILRTEIQYAQEGENIYGRTGFVCGGGVSVRMLPVLDWGNSSISIFKRGRKAARDDGNAALGCAPYFVYIRYHCPDVHVQPAVLI